MYKRVVKRILDIFLALLLMVPLALISLIVVPLIILEDGGKPIFVSRRVGKNCCIFNMYKFRTMKENAPNILNADGSTYNAEDDPRQTRIGKILRKTSIDELPQIINVLKGEMSFIGPRPVLEEQLKSFSKEELGKMKVLPGITGYTQAYYRNKLENHEERMRDAWYAKNVSLRLDMKIFLKTIDTVLHKDVYRN